MFRQVEESGALTGWLAASSPGRAGYDACVPEAEPRFDHEVLAVVLQVRERGREGPLWQRANEPVAGRWARPGGPLAADERLGTSLSRHLATKVDLTDIAHLEQLETRSDPQRDPRGGGGAHPD